MFISGAVAKLGPPDDDCAVLRRGQGDTVASRWSFCAKWSERFGGGVPVSAASTVAVHDWLPSLDHPETAGDRKIARRYLAARRVAYDLSDWVDWCHGVGAKLNDATIATEDRPEA